MSAFGDKVRATAKAHGWTPPTVEQVAARFGCTVEQARAGYARQSKQFLRMALDCERARAAGKSKFSGYPATVDQVADFRAKAARYDAISRGAA